MSLATRVSGSSLSVRAPSASLGRVGDEHFECDAGVCGAVGTKRTIGELLASKAQLLVQAEAAEARLSSDETILQMLG